jgi:hypothetical protein
MVLAQPRSDFARVIREIADFAGQTPDGTR